MVDLFAGEHRRCFSRQAHERFPAHVDEDPGDRAASECPRRPAGIIVGDRFPAIAADVESLAGQR
jgi:hypothetical protein